MFALADAQGNERNLDTLELLDALLTSKNAGRQDAYMCIDRARELFKNGQPGWVGYPSGAVVNDLNEV